MKTIQQTPPGIVAGPKILNCAQVANNPLQNQHKVFVCSPSNSYFFCMFHFPVVETVAEGGGEGDSGKFSILSHHLPSLMRQTFIIPIRAE